jgi:hypothetical protein
MLRDAMKLLFPIVFVFGHATAPILAQAVLTVDDAPGPGVMFVGIQPAIDAAADGDVLHIAPGTYASFTIDGKGLTLVGSGFATTIASGTTIVGNIPPGSRTTLHRMKLANLKVGGTAIQWGDTTTTASFEEIYVVNTATVDALRCDFTRSFVDGGLRIVNGDVSLSSCVVRMTTPGSWLPWTPTPNAAIHNGYGSGLGGPLTIADSYVYGPNAAVVVFITTAAGPGIYNTSAHTVRVFGASTAIHGGIGGTFFSDPFLPPVFFPHAPAIHNAGGSVVLHQVALVSSASAPVIGPVTYSTTPMPVLTFSYGWKTTTSATLTAILGGPNAAFAPYAIGFDLTTDRSTPPALFVGDFLLSSSAVLLDSGSLGPLGTKVLSFPGATMPPALLFLPLYLQVFTMDSATGVWSAGGLMSGLLAP